MNPGRVIILLYGLIAAAQLALVVTLAVKIRHLAVETKTAALIAVGLLLGLEVGFLMLRVALDAGAAAEGPDRTAGGRAEQRRRRPAPTVAQRQRRGTVAEGRRGTAAVGRRVDGDADGRGARHAGPASHP